MKTITKYITFITALWLFSIFAIFLLTEDFKIAIITNLAISCVLGMLIFIIVLIEIFENTNKKQPLTKKEID